MELDQEIEREHILLIEHDLTPLGLDGHYYFVEGMAHPVITINDRITDPFARNVIKAYTLGCHFCCHCNVFENPSIFQKAYQTLIRRWEIRRCIPIYKLIRAFCLGIVYFVDIAEFLEIPLSEMLYGFTVYQDLYGPRLRHGQYTITWSPFTIKKERR